MIATCHAHAPSGKKNGSHSSNAGAASTPPALSAQSEVFAWRRPRLRWIHGAVHPVSTLHAPQPASASDAHTSHLSKSKARKKAPSSSGRVDGRRQPGQRDRVFDVRGDVERRDARPLGVAKRCWCVRIAASRDKEAVAGRGRVERRRDAVEALGVPAGDWLLGEDGECVVGCVADEEESLSRQHNCGTLPGELRSHPETRVAATPCATSCAARRRAADSDEDEVKV